MRSRTPSLTKGMLEEIATSKGGDLLEFPVRPFTPALPAPAKKLAGRKTVTALLYGDAHFPFHDQEALDVIAAIGVDLGPDYLINMGDNVDAAHLSEKFRTDPKRTTSLQDEIDLTREHLYQMRKLLPKAEFWVMEGNHEERLTRALWNLDGPAKALSLLTKVQRALTWPVLLDLEGIGAKWVPMAEQSKASILPRFIIKHGSLVRQQSAYTAAAEWKKYGKSGASGHTHRLGVFYHRDHNGSHVWVETGCSCSLNPDYTNDPDWQQGCVVLTFDTQTGAVQVEPVYIHHGSAMWRGKFYTATKRRK
jgi:hypothetical protein